MIEDILSLFGSICIAIIMGVFVIYEEPQLAINPKPAQELNVDKRNMRAR